MASTPHPFPHRLAVREPLRVDGKSLAPLGSPHTLVLALITSRHDGDYHYLDMRQIAPHREDSMPRRIPRVRDGILLTDSGDERVSQRIAVGTPAWFEWLENAQTFAFEDPTGRFTARTKRRANGIFWYAHGRWNGKHTERYLGKAASLDMTRLRAVASGVKQRPVELTTSATPVLSSPRKLMTDERWPSESILLTKLSIPAVSPSNMPAARGLDRLSRVLDYPLTVLCAPAGYGKTTLLAHWASRLDGDTAWVALDASDNDPSQFWSYVAVSLAQHVPGLDELVKSVAYMSYPQPSRVLAAMIIAGLVHVARDIVLVLDNYQSVRTDNAAVHEGISFFVEHLPTSVHVVLATRTEPPLHLAKWRAYRRLLELSAEALALSRDETTRYLRDVMELVLSDDQVAALHQRTEGWVTALQLAALTMRERLESPEALVSSLEEDRRLVAYLEDEVLNGLEDGVRTFLLHVVLLDRLSGELCSVVTRARNGRAMLAALERAQLFLIRVDDVSQWYRFHNLFASALRRFVRVNDPTIASSVYPLASTWCQVHGDSQYAIEYALAGGDADRAAYLLDDAVEPAFEHSDIGALAQQIARLPEDLIRQRARLCVAQAYALAMTGNRAALLQRVGHAEDALTHGIVPTDPAALEVLRGEVQALRASVELALGEHSLRAVIQTLREALALLPRSHPFYTYAHAALGVSQMANGEVRQAVQTFSALLRASEVRTDEFYIGVSVLYLGIGLVLKGRLGEAMEVSLRAEPFFADRDDSRIGAGRHLVAGRVFYERNQLEESLGQLSQGIEVVFDHVTPIHEGLTLHAHVQSAQGDTATALRTMEETYTKWVHADVVDSTTWAWTGVLIRAYQAHLWLLQGDIVSAADWALGVTRDAGGGKRRAAKPRYVRELERLVLARLHIAQGKPQQALELLQPLQSAATKDGWVARLLEILVLRALAHSALLDEPAALSALTQAIELAAAERFIRVFLDGGSETQRLMLLLTSADQEPAEWRERDDGDMLRAFVLSVLHAFASEPGAISGAHWPFGPAALAQTRRGSVIGEDAIGAITPREGQVLGLLARGASNKDLARELKISVATVKHHVQSLFQKLDVQSRTQAVARARTLRLLDQVVRVESNTRRARGIRDRVGGIITAPRQAAGIKTPESLPDDRASDPE